MRTFITAILGVIFIAGCTDSTEPITPILEVNIATSGGPDVIDPDGYSLTLDPGPTIAIPANGLVKITDVPAGVYQVALAGLAANCTLLAPASRSVQLWENLATPARVVISVACQPNTGAVHASTETHGDDADSNGYLLHIRPIDGGAPSVIAIASSGEATRVVGAGAVEARLEGIADNCRVEGTNPRTLEIKHAEFLDLSFRVTCLANGSLSVSLRTAGERVDPDGYFITVQQGSRKIAERHVGANSAATLTGVAPGEYEVYLAGVAFYCDAQQPVPAAVRSRETTEVTMEASCKFPPEIAYTGGEGSAANITMMGIDGAARRAVIALPEPELDPAWSADGTRIAFTRVFGVSSGISVIGAEGMNQVNLTTSLADVDSRPDWSPDGKQIVFARYREGNTDIWVMDADGTNQKRLTSGPEVETDPSWSPDGQKLAYTRTLGSQSSSIYVMNVDGSGAVPLAGTTNGQQSAWSPDGTKLAFARLSSGFWSIEVLDFSDGKTSALISGAISANDPTWSPDGKAIAYAGDGPGCYYYYYGCLPGIVVVDMHRSITTPGGWSQPESNPDWRPRRP